MDRRDEATLEDLRELLSALLEQADGANLRLERLEARMGAVDAPTAESVDHLRQAVGRLDRIAELLKDMLGEMRVVSLFTTHMAKRFERELEDLRNRVNSTDAAPKL